MALPFPATLLAPVLAATVEINMRGTLLAILMLATTPVIALSAWAPKFTLLLVIYSQSGPNSPTSPLSVTTLGNFTGEQAANDCGTAATAQGKDTYAFKNIQFDTSVLRATLLCVPAN